MPSLSLPPVGAIALRLVFEGARRLLVELNYLTLHQPKSELMHNPRITGCELRCYVPCELEETGCAPVFGVEP